MSDSGRSGEKRKRKANDDPGEQPETKQRKSFALNDFLKGDVPVFEELINKNLLLSIYHQENARFIENFCRMGTKLAKAVSTQN